MKVNLTMPSKQYDQLYAEARKRRVTVPEVIRDALKSAYWPDDSESLGRGWQWCGCRHTVDDRAVGDSSTVPPGAYRCRLFCKSAIAASVPRVARFEGRDGYLQVGDLFDQWRDDGTDRVGNQDGEFVRTHDRILLSVNPARYFTAPRCILCQLTNRSTEPGQIVLQQTT